MISTATLAETVERLFWLSSQQSFTLNVSEVERLLDVELHDDNIAYVQVHMALRQLGVTFSYMVKSNTCGFERLFDINKWETLDTSNFSKFKTKLRQVLNEDMSLAYGNSRLVCGIGTGY